MHYAKHLSTLVHQLRCFGHGINDLLWWNRVASLGPVLGARQREVRCAGARDGAHRKHEGDEVNKDLVTRGMDDGYVQLAEQLAQTSAKCAFSARKP